jgi:hypothetical protein
VDCARATTGAMIAAGTEGSRYLSRIVRAADREVGLFLRYYPRITSVIEGRDP